MRNSFLLILISGNLSICFSCILVGMAIYNHYLFLILYVLRMAEVIMIIGIKKNLYGVNLL